MTIMNTQQTQKYNEIRFGFKSDPRWIEADEVRKDPKVAPEDYAWAVARCSTLEESSRRSAEQARIGGL
jgi:hypothetical protein